MVGLLALCHRKSRVRPVFESGGKLTFTIRPQLWLFRVYLSSADGFGSSLNAIINNSSESAHAHHSPNSIKLNTTLAGNVTQLVEPFVRSIVVPGITINKAGDLRALFEPVCRAKLPPTGWSKTIR